MDERLGLLENLRSARCTVSILTTYSIDFDFYETIVLRRLNAAGCEHHLLLVDADRCGEALADPERRPKLAGISYALVPIARAGAFHPKLIISAGKKSSRLFVGSHNVTFGGYGGNAEITNAIEGPRTSSEAVLVTEALDAVRSWIGKSSPIASEIIDVASSSIGPTKKIADAGIALLHTARERPPLWDQLRPYIPAKLRRVLIAGPFFDEGLQFIRQAQADCEGAELVVAIDPTNAMLNSGAARQCGVRFVDAGTCLATVGFSESSGLHAKLVLFEANNGRLVLASGSANPSAAAWLRSDTNSEAIIVRDVSPEDIARLGLASIFDASEITAAQWAELDQRVSKETPGESPVSAMRAFVADEDDGRLVIRGVEQQPREVRLLFVDARAPYSASFTYADAVVTVTGAGDELSLCNLVEVTGDFPGVAIVNHSKALAPRGDRGRSQIDLRAALNAVPDNPANIESVLKLVERAIDDVDEVDEASIVRRPAESAQRDGADGAIGPGAIRLEDVRRRHARPRSLATGDIGVVIDLLIRRIGTGTASAPTEQAREVEESELDPVEEAARAASIVAFDEAALLDACHRKVRRLLSRMRDRLSRVMETSKGATRALVQLTAVLGVLQWLRQLERQLAWLPFGKSLIPAKSRDDLFWQSAMCLAVSQPSLGDLASSEMNEPFDEMAIAYGLVAWLGREVGVDARTLARHPDGEQLIEFQWAGLVVMLMRHVVANEPAAATLTKAIADSRGADREAWLAAHAHLGAVAMNAAAGSGETAKRAPTRGDIVRIRMANGINSVGYVIDLDETRVRLLDDEQENGKAVLREYVTAIA